MVAPGEGEFIIAGLLDIPFIFDLIFDVSFSGSFSDAYLKRKGYLHILLLLLTSLHCFAWMFKTKNRELLQCVKQDKPVGFIQIESTINSHGQLRHYIMTCAIAPTHRGNRYGREMIELLIGRARAGTLICGVCTKYARAMQHTFKGLHFIRKSVGYGLDEYSYVIPDEQHTAAGRPEGADAALVRLRQLNEAA